MDYVLKYNNPEQRRGGERSPPLFANDPGNILATKNRIAHIRWRIQINRIICAKSPIQNCLSRVLKERVGIITLSQIAGSASAACYSLCIAGMGAAGREDFLPGGSHCFFKSAASPSILVREKNGGFDSPGMICCCQQGKRKGSPAAGKHKTGRRGASRRSAPVPLRQWRPVTSRRVL